jgi:branched-chain amino acid transport system substrate-binding protein
MKHLIAVLLATIFPLAAAAQDGKPIKIGFVTTLTTPAAAIGRDMVDGANLGIEHAGGKIAGNPIEIIFEDDGLKPDLGRQKAEKLVRQENVDVVAGFIWSNVLMA